MIRLNASIFCEKSRIFVSTAHLQLLLEISLFFDSQNSKRFLDMKQYKKADF